MLCALTHLSIAREAITRRWTAPLNNRPSGPSNQETPMPAAKHSALVNWGRAALSACLLSLAACGGPNSEESLARAEQQLAAGDYRTVIVELRNTLAEQDGEGPPRAHWMLGKAYLETGNMSFAERELERARKLGWNPNEVLPALAKSLQVQGKVETLEQLPTAALEPWALAQVKTSQALAQLAEGDFWDADSLVAEALELQPNDLEVRLAEARILGASGDIGGALAVVEQVLDTDLDNPVAWSLKAELLRLQERLPEALIALDTTIELNPESVDERSKRALVNLQLEEMDAMRVDADWLLLNAPKHPMSQYVQGILLFQDGDYPGSIAALEQAVSMEPRYPLVPFYLSTAHIQEGRRDAAVKVAQRLVHLHPGYAPGRKMLASIYLQAGDLDEIQTLLQPVLDSDPGDTQALNLMANALLLEGKTDQALELLTRLQQLNPESAEANFRLGAGLLLAGENEAATQQLAKALAINPQYQQADILLVLRLLEEEDFDGAITAAQAYSQRNPTRVTPFNLLGKAYLARQQTEEAVTAFNRALTLEPGDPAANQALADIALQSGDDALARKHYRAILEHRANYLPALLRLAVMEAREGDEAELVAQLNHAMKAHPEALEPRLMLGRYYLWKNELASIPPLFSALTELQQQSPEVLHLIALAQLADQRHTDAKSTLEQLVQLKPDTALAHHLLGTAAAGSGDLGTARDEFQRALAIDKNYVPTLVSLARLAWADGDTALFDQYLQSLSTLAAGAPDVLRLRAAANWRIGDQEQAIELAALAQAGAPGTDTTLELAGYQFMAGNRTEAMRIVENWVAQQPGDIRARKALASQLTHAGNIDQAIKQYRAVLELEPGNTEALNNLAWHLRTSDPQQAIEYARRAVLIEPNVPGLLDTLAVIEHLAGDNVQAQRHIKLAVEASPDDPILLYHQAQIEAALGQRNVAIKILEKVLARPTPDSLDRDDAKALLASLQQ